MKYLFVFVFLLFFTINFYAQEPDIENVSFKQDQRKLLIIYDIINAKKEQTFNVKLFYKINNNNWQKIYDYQLSGDVGDSLKPGKNKQIEWIPNNYNISIDGSLKFKVNATVNNIPEQENSYPEMVKIEGGTFKMGSNDGDSDEKPVHSVTVSTFYMSKYEVTHEQYIAFLNDVNCSSSGTYNGNELIDMDYSDCAIGHNGSFYFKGSGKADNKKCPVIEVTWYGANEYCNWLSKKTGETYRLPTEAEWEYAAGGGQNSPLTKGVGGIINLQKYAGTNTESELGDYAWYWSNSGSKTHAVGTKKPNELGLYNMSGNVYEWCQDWYDSDYYKNSPQNNPKGPTSGSHRVFRGGSWSFDAVLCRVADRYGSSPSVSDYSLGFRIIKTP